MIPTNTSATVDVAAKVPTADAVVVLMHKQTKPAEAGGKHLPREMRDLLTSLVQSKAVTGKSNEVAVQLLPGKKPSRLIVIGLGNREVFSCDCLREAGGALARAMRKQKLTSAAVIMPQLPKTLPGRPKAPHPAGKAREAGPEALATGFVLARFKFDEFKGAATNAKKDEQPSSAKMTIVVDDADVKTAREAVHRAQIVAESQNFARTIASRPGNSINPPALAKVAQQLAREVGLNVRVLDEKQMQKLGMGGILAVGSGSETPPRMIVLEWRGGAEKVEGRRSKVEGKKSRPLSTLHSPPSPLLVVGKAITFDTGGISIKPAEKMQRMIFDKSGGMAVLGLMCALARLKAPVHVVGILASAENHVSSTAYRPGDILRMYNGVTVEVTNTDAEGRLVLGDALAWGIETYKPAAVVDLATLTGGVVVALGNSMAGVMCNNDQLMQRLQRAADDAGEKIWRLPLSEDVKEMMKSEWADIVNSGGRGASPIQGAMFLSHFVPADGKVPWAHIDIAGVSDTEKELPYYDKGSVGWGVRTLLNWVEGVGNVKTGRHET